MTEFFYDYSCFIHYCCCLTFLTRWTYFYFELQISSITMHNGQTLVALKFMRSYEQFSCELRSRDSMNLQRDHVVGIIAHYGSGAVEDMNYMHQVRTCTRSQILRRIEGWRRKNAVRVPFYFNPNISISPFTSHHFCQ